MFSTIRRSAVGMLLALSFASAAAEPPSDPKYFNEYVLKAIDKIYPERKRGGYDKDFAYTRDLKYGKEVVRAYPERGALPENKRHNTMCVAAMAEIIIQAIDLYRKSHPDASDPRQQLPASAWNDSNALSFRPYLFLQTDAKDLHAHPAGTVPQGKDKNGKPVSALSRGSGHAFEIFRIGEELPFSALIPGDFMNFNRIRSGHAAIFISYIDKQNRYTTKYSKDVLGFQYFSAQGAGKPDAGLEYRDAYFGAAPGKTAGGRVADPNVRRSGDRLYLNGGRLWSPERWDISGALNKIQDKIDAKYRQSATRAADVAAARLESMPASVVNFSGEEE